MEGSAFIFDCLHLLYYKSHIINPSCGESSVDSPDLVKAKKSAINPINKNDNKCFQYTVTIALNHEENKKYRQSISKKYQKSSLL